MNTRSAVGPVVDAKAAIQRLDTISKTVESCLRVVPGNRELEGQPAMLVEHLYRRLRPT